MSLERGRRAAVGLAPLAPLGRGGCVPAFVSLSSFEFFHSEPLTAVLPPGRISVLLRLCHFESPSSFTLQKASPAPPSPPLPLLQAGCRAFPLLTLSLVEPEILKFSFPELLQARN